MYVWILVILIAAGSSTTIDQLLLAPVQNGDLGFLRALNNYFGCKTWVDTECTECSAGYIFNDNKICREVPPQCMRFNRGVGICQQCYLGYEIFSGQCILTDVAKAIDRGCKKFENGKCMECAQRFYFIEEGICNQVSDLCRKWNYNTGICTACYQGYALNDGKCQESLITLFGMVDPFCASWDQGKCLKCAERAYFGPIGICIPVSDFCRTWDNFDGYCLSCYRGYALNNGQCIVSDSNNDGPSDMGCRHWDWEKNICLECSPRWVFTKQRTCKSVSDDCKSYNEEGLCSKCYTGYDLENGECIFSTKNFQAPSDLGCKLWNWDDMKCLECSKRWVFNQDNICTPISDNCKGYNNAGKCSECYRGYDLIGNTCIISTSAKMKPIDSGCKIWDWEEQICIECSYRWYFSKNGKCEKVPDICKDYDFEGKCTDCYPGYSIQQGLCVESDANKCQIQENGICLECYPGYRVKNNECVLGNPLCKQANNKGQCTSCFATYVLYKKICVPLVKLVNLAKYYAQNDPVKLEQLKREAQMK